MLIRRFQFDQLFVISLIGLLLWLTYIAASWGLADLLAKQARFDMQQWKKQNLTTDIWKSTQATLLYVQYLESHHPDFLENIAYAHYLLYRYGMITSAEKWMALEQALDDYLEAAKQRPVSAQTWANIAIIKAQLGQYDVQFLAVIENATLLGPWEPFVQRVIADVGLAAWYRLPSQGREKGRMIVFAAVERGMRWQAKLMNTLIKKHQREYVICAYGRQKTVFADFCRSFFNTRRRKK